MEQAKLSIVYNNTDISADISNDLTNFSYSDKTSGESDEITMDLHNLNGLWGNEWYPEKGAELVVKILHGQQILECGTFEIDELHNRGSKDGGDVVTIKALGAGIKEGIRTILSHANENKTLKQIAETIAAKYNWTVQGNVPDIKIGRHTQHQETDLHYLTRLAAQFGAIFSVRHNVITFASIFDIESQNVSFTYKRIDLTSWNIIDKTIHVYLQAISEHYSIKKKKAVKFSTDKEVIFPFPVKTSGSYLNIKTRAENEQQADLMSKSALYMRNSLQQEGTITIPGNVAVVAGINISIEELGNFSGNYHVVSSKHSVNKQGGYVTDAEIKRVGVITIEMMKEQEPQNN